VPRQSLSIFSTCADFAAEHASDGERSLRRCEPRPENSIVIQKSPSNVLDLAIWWHTVRPASYYTFARGGLGWIPAAAVRIALTQKVAHTAAGRDRDR
jgi:hypothetical protein